MTARVHVGKRVAALRAAHGDSLRAAAERTGVSHTTIARIESGEATSSFLGTLRKIADGYHVTVDYLMTGRDPRREFESVLNRLSPEARSQLYAASTLNRVRMLLQFLLAEYPQEFPLERLGPALEIDLESLQRLIAEGEAAELPDDVIQRIGNNLARITAISRHWLLAGHMGGEVAAAIEPELLAAYLRVVLKAAKAGVKPPVLEMAVDLLIRQQQEVAAGRTSSH